MHAEARAQTRREECVTRNAVYLVSTVAIVRNHIAVTQTNVLHTGAQSLQLP